MIEYQGVKYRIVDAHTHWTKLITKVLKPLLGTLAIGEVVDNTIEQWDSVQKSTQSSFQCKIQLFLNNLDYFGIDKAILLPVFPFDAKFMINAEKFAPDRIIGLSGLLPRKSNRLIKLEEYRKMGCRGLKLHPAFNFFHPTNHYNAISEIFSYCQEHKMIIFIHAGSHYEIRDLIPLLKQFDDVTLILAHMGMGSQTDQSIECARNFSNVILDMSSQPYFYLINQAVHDPDIGIERVVYGSDFPMLNPRLDIMKICQLPISESERQLIFAGNIEQIFKSI